MTAPRTRHPRRKVATLTALAGAAALITVCIAGASGTPTRKAVGARTANAGVAGPTSGNLSRSKLILRSAVRVSVDHHSVTLPLHRGKYHGKTVWYILTEASEAGPADQLGLNFAPKLANLTAVKGVVQDVTLAAPASNKFGSATVHFRGIPDFKPTRELVAGPTGFPPAKAVPGAVGGRYYSPFIRIKGTTTVYNAPIVAVGKGHFDVTHHTDTQDRVLAIHKARPAGPGQFFGSSVEMLDIAGFDSGQPIVYLSTESSDPVTAVLERAIFVPALRHAPYVGGDDFLGSSRERIFPFVNGQTGRNNPQAQGLAHLIKDGHASEDASLSNNALLSALRHDGDALNVQGDFPTLKQSNREASYSPLWDATFGQWTAKAVKAGLNTRQTDEFQILHLAATRPDLLTGPLGTPYGSTNVLINCPVIAFLAEQPSRDLVVPKPGDAVDTPAAYQP